VWGWTQGQRVLDTQLPFSCEQRDVQVEGVVRGFPQSVNQQRGSLSVPVSRWLLHIDTVRDPLEAACAWPGGRVSIQLDALLATEPGARWALRVRLRRPVYPLNPGAPDRDASALHAGVRAVGTAKAVFARRLDSDASLHSRYVLLRWQLREQLSALPLSEQGRGLILALALGDRSALSETHAAQWRALGLSHLLVVSGLHVGLVAAWGWALGAGLGRLAQTLGSPWPAQHVAVGTALLAAAAYAALAGFAVPTQRALIAVTGFALCRVLGQSLSPWQALNLGLLGVSLLEPFAALSAGFWLSFAAVASILWLRQWQPMLRGWRFAVALQCLLSFALLPLGSWWFGEVSWAAPVVNLLAVPVVGLWMVPLCLLALVLQLPAAEWALWVWRGALLPLTALDWLGEFVPASLLRIQLLTVPWDASAMLLVALAALLVVTPLPVWRSGIPLLLIPAVLGGMQRSLPETTAVLTVLDV